MRTVIPRLAALTAVLALVPAASALAAPPDKQATLNSTTTNYKWTGGPGTGVVFTSTVGNRVGCTDGLFYCDFALIKTEEPGSLVTAISTTDPTLKDADLDVYESDADGTQGDLWGESTSDSAAETVALTDMPAGYWLVKVDYYLGGGSYNGTADFTPATTTTP
jgi:hypothetical protein